MNCNAINESRKLVFPRHSPAVESLLYQEWKKLTKSEEPLLGSSLEKLPSMSISTYTSSLLQKLSTSPAGRGRQGASFSSSQTHSPLPLITEEEEEDGAEK